MPTLRQEMTELLSQGKCRAKDISQILSIREKEVYAHLEHISRSAAAMKKKLRIDPAVCLACGYVFGDRRRFAKPGRCPECRSERISEPAYHVVNA